MVRFIHRNGYCPLAVYANDVVNGIYSVDFVNLAVTPTVCTIDGVVGAETVKDFGESPAEVDAPFGRNVILSCSGSNTSSVEVHGFDYLGQPMIEMLTLNGTSAVSGKKAFKYIQSIEIPNSTATVITVKCGNVLGLPYRTSQILAQTKDGVSGNTVTLTAPVNTVQTATSGDPRGTVTLGSYATPANFKLICVASPEIFTIDGKKYGGLQGFPHFC